MAFQGAKVANLFIMAKCLPLYFSLLSVKILVDIGFIDSFFFIAPRAGQPLPALRATICKKLVDEKLRCNFSFHIKYQSFQVFAFGVIYADGVVGGLCQLVKYAHVAFCHCCSCEHRCAEILLAHYLRA